MNRRGFFGRLLATAFAAPVVAKAAETAKPDFCPSEVFDVQRELLKRMRIPNVDALLLKSPYITKAEPYGVPATPYVTVKS